MYPYLDAQRIKANYEAARACFSLYGVDADAAIRQAATLPLSLHCWQGDDVRGFEDLGGSPGGGIMATGDYPGKARTPQELRADIEAAMALIPGRMKVNVHALYAETGGKRIDRDELEPGHFSAWMAWATERSVGLDFNPSFFSHPKAASGYTLSSPDKPLRDFWIRHAIRSRKIAAAMGKSSGMPAVNNIWIPDGSKDYPADRLGPRLRLRDALDEILEEKADPAYLIDAVESKLFGLGSEAYVVGSHEFYSGYAVRRQLALCLDMGHFHPTERIADKISALLPFVPSLLLHLSRGMRWDSDHVLVHDDDLQDVLCEIGRSGAWDRVALALDYFDASINRVMAWVIGARAARKAALFALLEPSGLLKEEEGRGRRGARLALMEEMKNMPRTAAWDMLCLDQGVPAGPAWIGASDRYEAGVLRARA